MIYALKCLVQIYEGDKLWFDSFGAFSSCDLGY